VSATPAFEVRDDRELRRFVLEQDGEFAELVYRERPGELILVHTGVPDAIGGRGIAGALVRAAVERARTEGRTVWPWCPYARHWLEEHPDVAGSVTVEWKPAPPR
jgi:predicted GNAT family acetyltransferase